MLQINRVFASRLINLAILSTIFSSCTKLSRPSGSGSEISGIAPSQMGLAPIPRPKQVNEIEHIKQAFAAGLAKKTGAIKAEPLRKSEFTYALISKVVEVGGIPRSQIKKMIESILADSKTGRGGGPCRQTFGLKIGEVDSYLNDLAANMNLFSSSFSTDQSAYLAGSLRKDEVKFQSLVISRAVDYDVGIYLSSRRPTWEEVMRLKKIEIREELPKILYSKIKEDLKLIPHVTLFIEPKSPDNVSFVEYVIKLSEFPKIGIRNKYLSLDLAKYPFLKEAKHIRSLTLANMNLNHIQSLSSLPPNLKHLEIGDLRGSLSDEKVALFNQLPHLESLSIGMPLADITSNTQVALKKEIKSILFYNRDWEMEDCGNLSRLAVFRNATFMTIDRCLIDSLKPSQLFAWQALYLKNNKVTSPALNGKIEMGDTMKNLSFFKSDNPSAIDLDNASRAKVEARIKPWRELENKKIIDAIVAGRP